MCTVGFEINMEEGNDPAGLNEEIKKKIEKEKKVNTGMQKSKDNGNNTFKVRIRGNNATKARLAAKEIQSEENKRKMRNTPQICKFYQQNRCNHGHLCKYLHHVHGGTYIPNDARDNIIRRRRS